MIELGMHTDNWRPLSGSFRTAAESAVKYGLKHLEFAVIHGQYFIQAMGYEPGISLQSNPRALRRYCEQKGLVISQIDGSYPLMGPDGSAFGVQYVQQSIRFAAELGCPMVDTVDGAFEIEGLQQGGGLPHHLRQLSPVPPLGRRLRRDHQRRAARPLHHRRRLHGTAVLPLRVGVPADELRHGQHVHLRPGSAGVPEALPQVHLATPTSRTSAPAWRRPCAARRRALRAAKCPSAAA